MKAFTEGRAGLYLNARGGLRAHLSFNGIMYMFAALFELFSK
jgi:hypothetical protein